LLLLCLLLAACAPSPNTPIPTIETGESPQAAALASPPPSAQPSPTPFIMPTLPPSPTPLCSGAPSVRLVRHERGRVLPDDPRPLNMRREPGTGSNVVVQIPIRGVFYVLDGPVCADDYTWYRIRYQAAEGWIAEGDSTSYYVEPYLLE